MNTLPYPECTHDEWIKICVICGKCLDDSTQLPPSKSGANAVTYYESFTVSDGDENYTLVHYG